ncbi:hypothetical protein [Actinoplanes sp. NPDC049316]|uniref:hypothetical protein n=1 Tax=Actinoplanes sp. NPDC049316 TaxID=3154727 RepID=UPI0034169263
MAAVVVAVGPALAGIASAPAEAAPAPGPSSETGGQNAPPIKDDPKAPTAVASADRDRLLGRNWRTSADRAWATSGDADGFHVLAAEASTGYSWKTVANLAEPGFEVDQWIGNACLTASGRRLVVVYGPRTFTNDATLFNRGAFSAVVDLVTGDVHKLNVQTTLAYYNPGCGAGEKAVLTQNSGDAEDEPAEVSGTRLFSVDATRGSVAAPVRVASALTSAVPTRGGIVAAASGGLVRVGTDGSTKRIAAAHGVPFRLTTDKAGGIVFGEAAGDGRMRVRRTTGDSAAPATLAEGPLTDLSLTAGAGGRVFLTGTPTRVVGLPAGISRLEVPVGSRVSSLGEVALTRVADTPAVGAPNPVADVRIEARVPSSGADLAFGVRPRAGVADEAAGRASSPALGRGSGSAGKRAAAATGNPNDPVDDNRWCSVPRNDIHNQALQPKPRQVEWAVDQAITNSLYVSRPANWKNLGMPAYTPQGLFPPRPLNGGGRVPAQVFLGVIAQESNMWQAARFALPGVTANPLIGNFYGRTSDSGSEAWSVHWEKADCGYGVSQVTDGMRLAGHAKENEVLLPYQTQRAVALDFAANVAAGLQILQDKWNQTRAAGMTINNGDPSRIENWFYALWAYNSGFHPTTTDGSPWGVGWGNNPINPNYDQQRKPFREAPYNTDAKTPQYWPYQEKVIGWAGHPVEIPESEDVEVAGFRAAWWSSEAARAKAKPDTKLFCDASNDCYPGQLNQPNDPDTQYEPKGPCAHQNAKGEFDLKCWFHKPMSWQMGPNNQCDCGNEVLRFDPGYAYQEDGNSYPPACDLNGLPAGAMVIDDVPTGTEPIRAGCSPRWTNAGSFGLTFTADSLGEFGSKINFHQIGGGFGAHFWSAYTYPAGWYENLKVTGTWKINPTGKWTRVFVHVPDQGAYNRQSDYQIYLPGQNKPTHHRSIPTRWQKNTWLDLGVFDFRGAGTPKVELSNITKDGSGDHKIVWDAIAVQPLASKPKNFVVAMGDSFSSGDGGDSYSRVSDQYADDSLFKNSCRRSPNAWSRKVVIPGTPDQKSIGALSDARDPNLDFHHIACSGAQTHQLMATTTLSGAPAVANASGNLPRDTTNGEQTQIDQGFLDENTTLVMLTIGGNDAGWTELFEPCLKDNCTADGYKLPGHSQPMKTEVQAKLSGPVASDVRRVMKEIRERAPNAQILLAGYPQILKDDTTTVWYTGPIPALLGYGLDIDESAWMNDMARVMATNVLYSDSANRINGMDIRADFHGHELGNVLDTTEDWLHFLRPGDYFDVTKDDDGEKNDAVVGGGSMHPNIAGYAAYGRAASDRLGVLGYTYQ